MNPELRIQNEKEMQKILDVLRRQFRKKLKDNFTIEYDIGDVEQQEDDRYSVQVTMTVFQRTTAQAMLDKVRAHVEEE